MLFAFFSALYPTPPILRDALGYTMTAQRVISLRMFSFGTQPPGPADTPNALVTPGYPLFLSALYQFSPSRSTDATATALAVQPSVRGVQFLIALVVVAAVAGCGLTIGGRKLAYLAGLAAALYPPFAWSTTVALSECLAAALCALQLLLALVVTRPGQRPGAALLVGLGVVSAAFALVRPVSALWILIPIGYASIVGRDRLRDVGRFAALALAGFALLMVPWWSRNAIVLDAFVPLSQGGATRRSCRRAATRYVLMRRLCTRPPMTSEGTRKRRWPSTESDANSLRIHSASSQLGRQLPARSSPLRGWSRTTPCGRRSMTRRHRESSRNPSLCLFLQHSKQHYGLPGRTTGSCSWPPASEPASLFGSLGLHWSFRCRSTSSSSTFRRSSSNGTSFPRCLRSRYSPRPVCSGSIAWPLGAIRSMRLMSLSSDSWLAGRM